MVRGDGLSGRMLLISFRVLRLLEWIVRRSVLCCLRSSFLGFPGGGVTPEKVLILYFLVILPTACRDLPILAEISS